jgi:hypothetical protein
MWLGILMTAILWGLMIWGIAALWGWARRGRPGPAGLWHNNPGPWGGGAGPWGGGVGPAGGGPGPRRDDDPEWILAQRFAAGEIDEDEYHQRLTALRSRPYADAADRR